MNQSPAIASLNVRGSGPVPIGSIFCIGRNYAEHAAELGNPLPAEPVVFLKSRSALRAPGDAGTTAFPEETLHHEAEVVLLVGKPIPYQSRTGLRNCSGFGLGLDLTRREVQNGLKRQGLPWTTAKSFYGSAVVSELLPADLLPPDHRLQFTLTVNDELRQTGDTAMMLWPLPALVDYLASLHPLWPGDLIFTGTPAGVGPIRRGDRFVLAFTNIPKQAVFHGQL